MRASAKSDMGTTDIPTRKFLSTGCKPLLLLAHSYCCRSLPLRTAPGITYPSAAFFIALKMVGPEYSKAVKRDVCGLRRTSLRSGECWKMER